MGPNREAPRVEFSDIDEFNETVQGWDLDFRQVERGSLSVGLAQYPSAVTGLLRVHLSRAIAQRGTPPPGMRTFGIRLDRLPWMEWCGREVSADALLCFRSDSDFECLSPGGFTVFALSFPEAELDAIAERLGHPQFIHDLRNEQAIDVSRFTGLRRLRKLLLRMLSEPNADSRDPKTIGSLDRLEQSVAEEIVLLLLESQCVSSPSSLRSRSRALKSAMSFILDNAHEAVTVSEVCEASGTSWRTLRRAFRESLGTSPKASIIAVRLQGARRALKDAEPDAGVADIANAWGFWHMGDFAMNYRREFAELPSETLRKQARRE